MANIHDYNQSAFDHLPSINMSERMVDGMSAGMEEKKMRMMAEKMQRQRFEQQVEEKEKARERLVRKGKILEDSSDREDQLREMGYWAPSRKELENYQRPRGASVSGSEEDPLEEYKKFREYLRHHSTSGEDEPFDWTDYRCKMCNTTQNVIRKWYLRTCRACFRKSARELEFADGWDPIEWCKIPKSGIISNHITIISNQPD
mmetsp:Transcript_31385/g.50414  ORF Transcript_31385/g.50414 Transcript_31385/m.50414 type:complete len:203 (-) Transcript_31385:348-956(-)